jgi:hypothetical protein
VAPFPTDRDEPVARECLQDLPIGERRPNHVTQGRAANPRSQSRRRYPPRRGTPQGRR